MIDSVVGLGRKSATLAGFEVHNVIARPFHIAVSVMLQDLLTSFSQQFQGDPKTAVCRFRPGDGLKKEINGRAPLHGCELGCDVRKAASLSRDFVDLNQTIETRKDRPDRFN